VIAFRGKLVPLASGGQYVVLSDASAVAAGVKQHDRVRGTVEGVPYQSSVGRYSGELHVGVHAAVLREIGAAVGDVVEMTIELDPDPPGQIIPEDLAAAMAASAQAQAGFVAMAPSHRREHVKHVDEAVKPETRERRIAAAIAAFEAHAEAKAAKETTKPAPAAKKKKKPAAKKKPGKRRR
jgi:hypothetical protein